MNNKDPLRTTETRDAAEQTREVLHASEQMVAVICELLRLGAQHAVQLQRVCPRMKKLVHEHIS